MSSTATVNRHWSVRERAPGSPGSLAVPMSPLALRYRGRRPIRSRRDRLRSQMCRILNVCVAVVGIILTAPLMLVVGLLVKLTSPGPVIYRQERVGIDRRSLGDEHIQNHRRRQNIGGRLFTIYKFRTMRNDPRRGASKEVWAAKNDPRITPIGKFLRATRIDELPQFFNVLKGDMNIVGPRPEQPSIFQDLQDKVGHYQRRQRVLPGITGLAQVELGYDTDIEGVKKKVRLDLEYIRHRSAAKDAMIMAKTVPVMVFRKVWM